MVHIVTRLVLQLKGNQRVNPAAVELKPAVFVVDGTMDARSSGLTLR